jgi:hypothetical protein
VRSHSGFCLLLGSLLAVAVVVPPARAQTCGHAVIVTLPGVTWSDVATYRLPNLIHTARDGAIGSMSVRTINPTTSYADAFATIGAGARIQGGTTAGGIAHHPRAAEGASQESPPSGGRSPFRTVATAGLAEIRILARGAGYGAQPGALGAALNARDIPVVAVGNADAGVPAPLPIGYGRWALLAAMDATGAVHNAAVGSSLLYQRSEDIFGVSTDPARVTADIDAALRMPCSVLVVDQGDLERSDMSSLLTGDPAASGLPRALTRADQILGHIKQTLDPRRDLLLVLSPTSPRAAKETHLGVAIAWGAGFARGTTLESASTRRAGFVTLPDVAPTILSFLRIEQPSMMNGQPWSAVAGPSGDRMQAAISADDQAVFVDRLQSRVSTGFVAFQVAVYLVALVLLARVERGSTVPSAARRGALEVVVLSVVAFPLSTYLAGAIDMHRLGSWGAVGLLITIDAVLIAVVTLLLRTSLDRLLGLTAATVVVLVADLVLGARLELSTIFGYSPVVAGRFAGLGNIGFAVLASSAVLTGALVVHRWDGSRMTLIFAATLFVVTIVADGAPQLGSDVGGVIALVPALLVTWILLTGRRLTIRALALAAVGVTVALAVFLTLDLARPAASQTHLARLFESIRAQGISPLFDTIERKARANLRVFGSTIWTLFVPPALAVLAWLLLRPRGRWEMLVETYPRLRAGLVGALLIGVLGFAVNDSGIVIPAMVLSFFVPLAVLLHLSLIRVQRA